MVEPAAPQRRPPGWIALALLLLVYVGLAIAYQRVVPLFEGPDEPSHIQYVVFLNQNGRPPRTIGAPEFPGESMQPPLYYALLQPIFALVAPYDPMLMPDLQRANLWIYLFADLRDVPPGARIRMRGTTQGTGPVFSVDPALDYLRALRWGSVALGALTLALTFDAARRVSRSSAFALLCASLLVLSPQFLFVSSYVNNDVACAALGASAFWIFARVVERNGVARIHYLGIAALSAVALATKLSALPVMAVCGVALLGSDRRPLRDRLRDVGLAAALGLALALPSLSMNWSRFGEVLGSSALIASSDSLGGFETFGGRRAYFLYHYPCIVFRTYWATFGWLNVVAPNGMYLAFFALCAAALLGLGIAWRSARRTSATDPAERDEWRRSRALRRYVLATALATLAAHAWLNLHVVANQGRHLFGASPQIAAALAIGIGGLVSGRAFGVGWRTAAVLFVGMLSAAAYCLTQLLLPAYG